MAAGEKGEALETLLNKVTDPENESERWDCIQAFYEQVNRETDGPQTATRLLAHKIQSPQEREALQALTLLEACMNNCGKKFHSEAGKFRFLNELIKVLSPKYLGTRSTVSVKQRVTEVLYGWSVWLKDEPKVQEAYHMLKKQGIVNKDPKLPDMIIAPPPSPRAEASVFDDEDKSKLLARLLKSPRPEDLQTANRLIKNIVKEDQDKMEREHQRISTLQDAETSTTQLQELLSQHIRTTPNTQCTQQMKMLYEHCEKLRPSLFRLASDTMDNDEALAEILQANDKLTLVVNCYKQQVDGTMSSVSSDKEHTSNHAPTSPREIKSYHLIDLSALESTPKENSLLQTPGDTHSSTSQELNPTGFGLQRTASTQSYQSSKSYLEELIQLEDSGRGDDGMETYQICGGDSYLQNSSPVLPVFQPAFRDLRSQSAVTPTSLASCGMVTVNTPFAGMDVSLDSIKPSRIEPITLFDCNGVRVSLHFCREPPPPQPHLAIFIISVVNTSAFPVTSVLLQAAVPKTMMVKLQPASGKDLPPYNPISPPAAISQILLLSNPYKGPVRLRYRLSLTQGLESVSHTGETDQFPDWNSWTCL
ncbi:ADP-ribosylation factor-binding protein GGA3-like [Chanos chanos]|uniref:ADP-ribosylation factor-binding protein GGA3-like n=1 Tax=Chanos chanos TaxID=29144 RepID=A0A6J2VVY8_CHACN|nr:ADP-ribosylation factor-binding protein GGA3-like [Chanos chanos]